MLNVFTDERYLKAREEHRVEVFENTNVPLLTPEYVLSLNSTKKQDWRNDDQTITLHDGLDIIPELKGWEKNCLYVPVFIELEDGHKSLGRHRDGNEVLFVQTHGSTHWYIEDFYHELHYEVTLNPSDAVYMPRAFFHTVTTMQSPRLGLSIIVG